MRGRLEIAINDAVGQKKFARLNHLFANPMPVLQKPVRALVREAMREQFESEGAWGGESWVKLADATVEERTLLAFGPAHPILQRTGRLYDAMQGKMSGGVGGRITVSKNVFTLRTVGIPDAAAHQRGSDHSNLPARPIVPEPMPQSFMRQLRSILSGYIVRARF